MPVFFRLIISLFLICFTVDIYASTELAQPEIKHEKELFAPDQIALQLLDVFKEEEEIGGELPEKRQIVIDRLLEYVENIVYTTADPSFYCTSYFFRTLFVEGAAFYEKINAIIDDLIFQVAKKNIDALFKNKNNYKWKDFSDIEAFVKNLKVCEDFDYILKAETYAKIYEQGLHLQEILPPLFTDKFSFDSKDTFDLFYPALEGLKNYEKFQDFSKIVKTFNISEKCIQKLDSVEQELKEKEKEFSPIKEKAKEFAELINHYAKMKELNRLTLLHVHETKQIQMDDDHPFLEFYKSLPNTFKTDYFMFHVLKDIDDIKDFISDSNIQNIFDSVEFSEKSGDYLREITLLENNKLEKVIEWINGTKSLKDIDDNFNRITTFNDGKINIDLVRMILNKNLMSPPLLYNISENIFKSSTLAEYFQKIIDDLYYKSPANRDRQYKLFIMKKIFDIHRISKNIYLNNVGSFLKEMVDLVKSGDDVGNIYRAQHLFYVDVFKKLSDNVTNLFWKSPINEESIVHYFSLKTMEKDSAFNAIKNEIKKRNLNLDLNLIKKYLDEIFKSGLFLYLNDSYKKASWQGYYSDDAPQENDTTFYYTKQRQTATVKLGATTYTYQFCAPQNNAAPKTIVFEIYGGYQIGFCQEIVSVPFSDSMMTVKIELPDCEKDIFQTDQLTPEHFKDTHAEYIAITAQFITFLKEKYPSAKIFLKGESFGGFFVSSYALISDLENFEGYKDFAKEAFLKKKEDLLSWHKQENRLGAVPFPKVDGIINHDGGIDYLSEILKNPASLKSIKTPILIHQNYDDHRVPISRIYDNLQCFDPSYLRLILSRTGAQPFLGEFNNFPKESISIRGHTNNAKSDTEFTQEILHFMDMVDQNKFGKNRSSFDLEQTKRRIKLSQPTVFTDDDNIAQRIGDHWFTKKDVEQFLSNIKNKEDRLNNIDVPAGITEEKALSDLNEYTSTKALWKELLKKTLVS